MSEERCIVGSSICLHCPGKGKNVLKIQIFAYILSTTVSPLPL